MNQHCMTASTAAISMCLLILGCAGSGHSTQLRLASDSHAAATYEFRDVFWRPSPDGGKDIEIIGLGFVPFRNDPGARSYNSHWPTSGFVKFWLHVVPRGDDRYALTILGPAKMLGPGDDEVLSGETSGVNVASDGEKRIVKLSEVPIKSRNKPDASFTLSGTVVAKPASAQEFSANLRQFTEELNSRDVEH